MKKQVLAILLVLAFIFGLNLISCGSDNAPANDANVQNNDGIHLQDNDIIPWDEPPYPDEDIVPWDEPPCPDEDTQCPIEEMLFAPNTDYSSYFGILALGTINDSNSTARPLAAYQSKFFIKLENYPTHLLKSPYIFYQDTTLTDGSPAIALFAMGDPLTKLYGTQVVVTLSKADLMAMKKGNITNFGSGVQTQVNTIEEVSDGAIAKICSVGYTDIDDSIDAYAGSSKLCSCCNYDFAIGETMRFSTNVKINEDPQYIMKMLNVTTGAELCTCLDAATKAPVDCPEAINDNDTTTDNTITTDE